MTNRGPAERDRPEDVWWHAVYTGPAATLPDTPSADPGDGTVDDWFDSAVALIGAQRTPVADSAVVAAAALSGEGAGRVGPSVDDWFDSAVALIGAQRAPAGASVGGPADSAAGVVGTPDHAEGVLDPTPEASGQEPDSGRLPPVSPRIPPLPGQSRRLFGQPVPHVGERPPTYAPEPTVVPAGDPDALAAVVPDTALEGAQYGTATLRAASVRGDSARYRGEPRRDGLLVTRFGAGEDGLLVAVLAASGARAQSSVVAVEACRRLAAAIGRSRTELAADLRAGARDRLRYGLQRLTARAAAGLPGRADGLSDRDTALHCLLLSMDPAAGHRAAFGTGPGGLYLLRSGHWIDAYAARLLHHPEGGPPAPAEQDDSSAFRYRLIPATSGDVLLLCTDGLAAPVTVEPGVARFLADHWTHPHPPDTVDFLRQIQVRAKGYADDRTAITLWTD